MNNVEELLKSKISKKPETELSLVSKRVMRSQLSKDEQSNLKEMLSRNETTLSEPDDYQKISELTSELHSITSQAILLHGERISQCREILKRYREGAFTEWLLQVYNNRQTPYNFLKYYELHQALDNIHRIKMLSMPKRAIYLLSSRNGSLEKKISLIRAYSDENRDMLIEKIKKIFPAKNHTKINRYFVKIESLLGEVLNLTVEESFHPSKNEKRLLERLVSKLKKNLSIL